MANTTSKLSRTNFLDSELCAKLREELVSMTKNPSYNTHVTALIKSEKSLFVEKHLKYIVGHPKMDPWQYVQNLKLMTRLR